MLSSSIIELKMSALMGLGWRSIIQMDPSHALLKLNSKDELKIDVNEKPCDWTLLYKGKFLPCIGCSENLPEELTKKITKLVSQYNTALQEVLDEITDWRGF